MNLRLLTWHPFALFTMASCFGYLAYLKGNGIDWFVSGVMTGVGAMMLYTTALLQKVFK